MLEALDFQYCIKIGLTIPALRVKGTKVQGHSKFQADPGPLAMLSIIIIITITVITIIILTPTSSRLCKC